MSQIPEMTARVATTTRDFLFQEEVLTEEAFIAAMTISGMVKTPAENNALRWQSDTAANPTTLNPREDLRTGLRLSAREIKADSTAETKDKPIKYVCNGPNINKLHGKA